MQNAYFATLLVVAFTVAGLAGAVGGAAQPAALDARLAFAFSPDRQTAYMPIWAEDGEIWTQGGTNVVITNVFGSDDRAKHAPDLWTDPADAFDPAAVPTDSVTFNPALLLHTDRDYVTRGAASGQELDWIRACSQDSNLKKHLRTWYEPNHDFHGPRVDSGNYNPATVADVIQVESTYYLIDAASFRPNLACAGSSSFPFPTEGIYTTVSECTQEYGHLQYMQPGLDTLRPVKLTAVQGSGTAGTIRVEYRWTVDTDNSAFDCLQFFDHMLHIKNTNIGASTSNLQLRAAIWYTGNTRPDSREDVTLTSALTFWDRDNNGFPDAVHNGGNGETRTFYTRVEGFPRTTTSDSVDGVVLTVGKEFRQGDIFYVDGVRYEVPAIHIVDGNLASFTLRTPLPKGEPCDREAAGQPLTGIDQEWPCDSTALNGARGWTSVPGQLVDDHRRVIVRDNTFQVEDFSVVTTQWVAQYNTTEPLPVDPPFNREFYRQVDDTDVILWECRNDRVRRAGTGDEANCLFFPYGEVTMKNNVDGLPRWPEAERYLTMQEPPQAWIDYWAAEKTDAWAMRDRFPADTIDPESYDTGDVIPAGIEPGINPNDGQSAVYTWCGRAVTCVNSTTSNFVYHYEWTDPRFTTNLLQIPSFEGSRSLGRIEVNSMPDRKTTIELPGRSNFASELNVCFERDIDIIRGTDAVCNDIDSDGTVDENEPHAHVTLGDYLHTSAWFLPDRQTRHAFTIGGHAAADHVNVDFLTDLHVEADDANDRYMLRLYGSADRAAHAPDLWSRPADVFDPAAIPRDSVTWNPALILHTDRDYVSYEAGANDELDWIRACSQDSNLKKHLRTWYEPNHDFHGPRVDSGNYAPATVADVIQIESTYYLVDASSFKPTLACAGSSQFPFPTEGMFTDLGRCVEEYGDVVDDAIHYQPGLDTLRPVKVAMVSGTGTAGTVRLEMEWTVDTDNGAWDCLQFFDHMLTVDNTIIGAGTSNLEVRASIWYIGNTKPDSREAVTLTGAMTFWDRDNNGFADAVHNGGNGETRTFYTKVMGFPRTTTSNSVDGIVIKVGKELRQGDIFYVDGVRYEVPSVHVVDGNLASITLRTPLPKSEPCQRDDANGNNVDAPCTSTAFGWSSVPGEQIDRHRRSIVRDGTWKDEDFSVVTTQWIVEYNIDEPLPVDPPFNREYYRQVDDTDVLMWRCRDADVARDGKGDEADCTYFPYGEISLRDNVNGLPRWPLGERYLTMAEPPQEWIDYWALKPSRFVDIRERFPSTSVDPEVFSTHNGVTDGIEAGVNWDAWCQRAAQCITPGHVTFSYYEEWYEERLTTDLMQIPVFTGQRKFEAHSVESLPDRYTTFVLPDRSNMASARAACFERYVGPIGLWNGDLTCDGAGFDLNAGDYLVTTSLRTQGTGQSNTSTTTSDTETSTRTTTTTSTTSTTSGTNTGGGGQTQTPGFEIIALLAALAVAFVLVRRRV